MSETRRHWFGFNIDSASDMEMRLERVLEARPGLSFRRIVETGAVAWLQGYRLVDLPEMGGPQVMHRRSPPAATAMPAVPATPARAPAPAKSKPAKKRGKAKAEAPAAATMPKGGEGQAKAPVAPTAPAPAPAATVATAPAAAPKDAAEQPPQISVKAPDKIEAPPVVGDVSAEQGNALVGSANLGAEAGAELEEGAIDVDGFTLDFNSFLAK